MRVFTVFKYDHICGDNASIGVFSSFKKAVKAAREDLSCEKKSGREHVVEYSIRKDILDKETCMAPDWMSFDDALMMLLDHEGSEYAKLWLEE